jgi:hypothetical protein
MKAAATVGGRFSITGTSTCCHFGLNTPTLRSIRRFHSVDFERRMLEPFREHEGYVTCSQGRYVCSHAGAMSLFFGIPVPARSRKTTKATRMERPKL